MVLKVAFVLLVLAVVGEARHVHPRKDQWSDLVEESVFTLDNDHDATETEITNIAPKKLSPHSILFFKSYDPCEDGFQLDYQGICREVWF